ncbi:SMI1/KNR4 family protein [Prescottella defluvii]|uniref:SMI1/KNR4 family protein n=1 Tax=Prescottella defluvii TaxID=1323361 RepID=UPI00068B160E|nr:SMI1/KNR4 family protein [Prescottella defluvii]
MVYWAVAWTETGSDAIRIEDGYLDGGDAAVSQIVEVGRRVGAEPGTSSVWAHLDTVTAQVPAFGAADTDAWALAADVRRCIADAERQQRAAESAAAAARANDPRPIHPTPSGSVREQWARIADWLCTQLSDVEFRGADQQQIAAAVAATGQAWPDELVDLFSLANGGPEGRWIRVIPGYELFTLDRVVADRERSIRIWDEGARMYGIDLADPPAGAGFEAGTFIPAFVPFAGRDSNYLCVDTRPGPLYGSVLEFDETGADADGPAWQSVSALLTDIADALTQGTAFVDGQLPFVRDGSAFEWDSGDRAGDVEFAVRNAAPST